MDYAKAANKNAQKLAAGGHTKSQKRKLVHQWAQNMKAMIEQSNGITRRN